ncbi:hypothetical protein FNV43_RR02128 [Rhamnella rubrinervis]|uniref:S-protein homolog n=1 Tax=Rhamnella rubrinervis TaxID=2594499 RepID=A0A8K0HT93_9ROSA|nr:hypothetical protein FNV43_RR02128 [Rhamnella rubrinervis]
MSTFNMRNITTLLLFLVFLITATTTTRCNAGFLQKKAHIHIINNLDSGLTLTVHCKSKNSDLGAQVLPPNASWEFHFRPNFWGTTLFFCSMNWQGASKYTDIYVQNRDQPKCSVCYWSIKQSGPCMLNYGNNKYDICYPWNKY